ncbi:hypothetical protein [Rhodococcus zopfii]|uniref:hypothetical protein n=1 Tax=Rhodococcus zopfii TaxID=43772 RepID=UPI00093279ED|nr:hypothetical protein [Rhodococcus zopfii]
MLESTKALIIAFVAAIVTPGIAAPGAHRPELLGSRGIPVAHLVRPATLSALTSCPSSEFVGASTNLDQPIPYVPVDRGEIVDPDAPIGYEIVETAAAQVLVPAVAR